MNSYDTLIIIRYVKIQTVELNCIINETVLYVFVIRT